MKVPPYYNSCVGKAYSKPPQAKKQETSVSKPSASKKDEMTLSSRADEVLKYKEMAKTIPDMRQDKIETIKKQIESGTYNVPAELVAKSILKSAKNTP